MTLSLALAQLQGAGLASVRIAVFLLLAPPFSSKQIPGPVKAGLSLSLGILIAHKLPVPAGGLDGPHLAGAVGVQVLAGALLGFGVQLVFAAIRGAGSLIDLFGGFQMASAFDPLSMSQATPFGRMFELTALTLLFCSDGYQLVVAGLLHSFDVFTLSMPLNTSAMAAWLTGGLTTMFVSALQIAAPIAGVLFLADVGLGLLTKAAPALNVFSLGYALKILLTLSFITAAMTGLPQVVATLVQRALAGMPGVSG